VAFLSGDAANIIFEKSDEEIVNMCVESLCKLFPEEVVLIMLLICNFDCENILATVLIDFLYAFIVVCYLFLVKPPPPVGAGGGYMFSGRTSVPLSVRPCVRPSIRPSVIHMVVLCLRDISSIC